MSLRERIRNLKRIKPTLLEKDEEVGALNIAAALAMVLTTIFFIEKGVLAESLRGCVPHAKSWADVHAEFNDWLHDQWSNWHNWSDWTDWTDWCDWSDWSDWSNASSGSE